MLRRGRLFSKLTSFAAMAVAMVLSSAVAPQAASNFNAKDYWLDNGLQLVVIENHRAPIVTHMVWYRVGAIDEYEGKSGLAHFLEHLMFKGTSKMEPGEFSKTIAKNGGQDNAFTSSDYTAYYQNVAADRLELVMSMEADRMVNLDIAEDEVAAERDVVIEERRSRVDNSPSAAFREKLSAARYDVHPYRVPIIGWPEDLKTLNREDAMGFYKSFYGPNNAIVVVVGDVVPEEVLALAQKHYGVLEAREIADRFHPPEPAHTEARRLVHRDPRVRQPSWNRSYRAPSVGTGNKVHIPALEVLSEIVGGGSISRLYRQIVVEDKLAIDVGSYYSDGRLGPGTFALYAVPVSTDTAALEAGIEDVLADILENGVTAEELERAKRSLTASVIYAQDSGRGLANIFGASLVNGQTIEDLEAWPDHIAAVSYDDILAAAKHVLVAEQSITGILLPPSPEQPDAGDAP